MRLSKTPCDATTMCFEASPSTDVLVDWLRGALVHEFDERLKEPAFLFQFGEQVLESGDFAAPVRQVWGHEQVFGALIECRVGSEACPGFGFTACGVKVGAGLCDLFLAFP